MWFPWHPLVVSIRGWPFPGRFDKGMDALAPMDFHLGGHQQLGFHLTLPFQGLYNHINRSSSSTACWRKLMVATPTVRFTSQHRIIQDPKSDKKNPFHLSVFRKWIFPCATSEISHYSNLHKRTKYYFSLLECHLEFLKVSIIAHLC